MADSLSPEELERALAERPKHPLTHEEVEALREVVAWWEIQQKASEQKQIRREIRWKRIPVIFGSLSAVSGIYAFANLVYHFFYPPRGP